MRKMPSIENTAPIGGFHRHYQPIKLVLVLASAQHIMPQGPAPEYGAFRGGRGIGGGIEVGRAFCLHVVPHHHQSIGIGLMHALFVFAEKHEHESDACFSLPSHR